MIAAASQIFSAQNVPSPIFKTCEHQHLPMIEGPPMTLMIYPKTELSAYHSPVPVPIHWKEDVKAGLDRYI